MFTGIVEAPGTVRSFLKKSGKAGAVLELAVPKKILNLKTGGSLAVNGVCLTVTGKRGGSFFFNVIRETLRRTTLGGWKTGDRVNLERPVRARGRLDGHVVLGHVDGVGRVVKTASRGQERSFLISFPPNLKPYILEKGSIAADGVSMTVGRVARSAFWLHGIPHTLQRTSFGALKPGSRVNLEADILAKLARGRKRC